MKPNNAPTLNDGDISSLALSNPFSSRFVRPGAIDYVFAPGPKSPQLIDRLMDTGGWGQIIGAHGSGKSTLLETLRAYMPERDICSTMFTLRDRQRRMPTGWREQIDVRAARVIVIVDGYEQLTRLSRLRLKRACRRAGYGLLVTSHASVGLPIIYRTSTSEELAEQLVANLLAGQPAYLSNASTREAYAAARGNLREMFFALFDQHERHYRHNA